MRKLSLIVLITFFLTRPGLAQLPDVTLSDCKGVSYNLYQELAAGNAVVLKFCTGWCGPCVISNPLYESLYQELAQGNCKVKLFSMLFETTNAGEPTNCAYGLQYAKDYNLSMPIITDIGTWYTGLTGQFASLYNITGIPTTLVILPNQADPSKSIVKSILGLSVYNKETNTETMLDQVIKDTLASGGFYSPKFKVDGSLCSNAPYSLKLSSNAPDGNLWSTGATTPSITIDAPGEYSVTLSPGCTYSKTLEFTAIPPVGTASISNATVCQDGQFTLDYSLPAGSPDDVTWLYRANGDSEWQIFQSAKQGSLTIQTQNFYPAGTVFEFVVRVQSENAVCSLLSNIVKVTVTDAVPGLLTGVTTGPSGKVCLQQDFTLNYTDGLTGAVWTYLNPEGYWDYFAPADQPVNPSTILTLNRRGTGSDLFRVRYFDGNCFLFTEPLEVSYHLPTIQITGSLVNCIGTNLTLELNGDYSNILWSTAATTPSITVSPAVTTTYTVTATEDNGCRFSDDHLVTVPEKSVSMIASSAAGTVCGSAPVTLSFTGTNIANPCTEASLGQWPLTTFTNANCNGSPETIVNDGFLGEYSVVHVTEGLYYRFTGQMYEGVIDEAIIVTITAANSIDVYASGVKSAVWKASFTGEVRFITSAASCIPIGQISVLRTVACSANPSAFGTFSWMPGGQTSASITVSPAVTTDYTLMFSEIDAPCPASSKKQVVVGIGALDLSTINITCNSATLNWNTAANPAEWEVEYKTIGQGSKWTKVPVANASIRSVIIKGLKANQGYIWHIRAKCGKSWTKYSDAVPFTTTRTCNELTTRQTTETEIALEQNNKGMSVKVMPNPSNTNFRIVLNSSDLRAPVQLTITDILGRVVETRIAAPGQLITLGDQYKAGTYVVRFIQGSDIKQLKLIKL